MALEVVVKELDDSALSGAEVRDDEGIKLCRLVLDDTSDGEGKVDVVITDDEDVDETTVIVTSFVGTTR